MIFGLSLTEAVLLVIASLFIFGPDRLPQAIARGVRVLGDVRAMVASARRDLGDALGPELRDLGSDLHALDPRTALLQPLHEVDTVVAHVEGDASWRGRVRRTAEEPAASDDVVEAAGEVITGEAAAVER